MTKRAFTLIELLVVIAIIAILAAILFPVFAQAKAAAKKTQALSNVKQNAVAVLLYNTDGDDTFAQSAYCLGTANGVVTPGSNCQVFSAYDAVFPYTKNKDIFLDPADPKAIDWDRTLRQIGLLPFQNGGNTIMFASTGLNFGLFEDPSVGPTLGGDDPVVSESSIPLSAETTMMFSARYLGGNQTNLDVPGTPRNPGIPADFTGRDGKYGPRYRQTMGPFSSVNFPGVARHTDTLVVNFVDGHAKAFPKNGRITQEVAPDIDPAAPNTFLPVYNLPYDINGIPQVKAEGRV